MLIDRLQPTTEQSVGPIAAHGRSVRARRTAILGAVYQVVFAIVQLISLALLARNTTREVFGLWMTVLAVSNWAPIAYFGQPAALLTRLGAVALTDKALAQRLFTASTAIVLTVTALLTASLLCAAPWLPWASILNASTPGTTNLAQPTAILAIVVALIANPATISNFALLSHQRGDVVHTTMIAGSLVGLLLLAVGVWTEQPLHIAGALMLCGPLLGGLTLWLLIFRVRLFRMPHSSALDYDTVKSMAVIGLHFVAIDMATFAVSRAPDLIVAQIHGPEAVAIFSAVGRLPLMMLAVFQALLVPYWPALAEAIHRRDDAWVRRVVVKSLASVLAIGVISAMVMAMLGARFIRIWLGIDDPAIEPLVRAACLQTLGMGMLAWLGVLFGALSMFRHQLLLLTLTAAVGLMLALALGPTLGPVGVAFAQAGALLGIMVPAGGWLLFRRLR